MYTNDTCTFIPRLFSYLDVENILTMFGGKKLAHPVYILVLKFRKFKKIEPILVSTGSRMTTYLVKYLIPRSRI